MTIVATTPTQDPSAACLSGLADLEVIHRPCWFTTPHESLADDQCPADPQRRFVVGPLASDQSRDDTQMISIAGFRDADQGNIAPHTPHVGVPEDLLLAVQTYKATQQLRIATSNRIGAVTREAEKAGVTPPDLRFYDAQLKTLLSVEGKLGRHVQKLMREHPLYPWVQARHGIGVLGLARFLGSVYTVSWNTLENRPRRGPAELWAYCGFKPGQRHRKGQRSNWSTEAKIAALSLAEGCVKAGPRSPYEPVYRAYRERYADRLHTEPCAPCGAKGKPAQIGTPLRPGHQQAMAIRATAKRILRDLFIEADRLGV